MAQRGGNAGCGTESAARQAGDGSAAEFDTTSGEAGFRWINGRDPRQYGLDFGLWTRSLVAALIERKFAIRLGVTAVGELLAKLGLTPQKPLQRAYQRDPEAIEAWRRERYPAIARQAKASGGEVYFWMSWGFVPIACTARPGARRVRHLWSNALANGNLSVTASAVSAYISVGLAIALLAFASGLLYALGCVLTVIPPTA